MRAQALILKIVLATLVAGAAAYYAIASVNISGIISTNVTASELIKERCPLHLVRPEWVGGKNQRDMLVRWPIWETKARLAVLLFVWVFTVAMFMMQSSRGKQRRGRQTFMQHLLALFLILLTACSTSRVSPTRFEFGSLTLSHDGIYNLESFIPAAMALQAMGPEAGSQALLQMALAIPIFPPRQEDYAKVAVLCRMVFTAKPGTIFPRPLLGAPDLPGDTTSADWPLAPIELVDGYPFWIAKGYSFGGFRGPVADDVRRCMAMCDWNRYRFRMLTAKEKRVALAKLLNSPKWKHPLDENDKFWFFATFSG